MQKNEYSNSEVRDFYNCIAPGMFNSRADKDWPYITIIGPSIESRYGKPIIIYWVMIKKETE